MKDLKTQGFQRIELVAVLAVLTLLALVVWPTLAASRSQSIMVECGANLRRVGQGFQVWSASHGDQFPWMVPSASGGSQGAAQAYQHFLVVSNEFGTPRFLFCPADGSTQFRAASFGSFGVNNLSYFAGLHGSLDQPRAWLAGDHYLTGLTNQFCSVALNSVASLVPTNTATWDARGHGGCGNLLLTDGSVRPLSNRELTNALNAAVAQAPEQAVHIQISP